MADCLICDAKMKHYSKAYCKTSHGYQHRENTDCFQSKLILGRRNEEVSAYNREESASLELNPLMW